TVSDWSAGDRIARLGDRDRLRLREKWDDRARFDRTFAAARRPEVARRRIDPGRRPARADPGCADAGLDGRAGAARVDCERPGVFLLAVAAVALAQGRVLGPRGACRVDLGRLRRRRGPDQGPTGRWRLPRGLSVVLLPPPG